MAWDVHIHVCFACSSNDGVAKLAQQHLENWHATDDGEREARWFLESLSQRTGPNYGPKGGLSLWGIVGNYTRGLAFCEVLIPFWQELLGEIDGGPLDFERVVVFTEDEQSEAPKAFQIGWDDAQAANRKIVIQQFDDLPFSWSQS